MVNTTELRRAMELVLDADAQNLHEQSAWIAETECGTAGCFAGLYAIDCGCTPVYMMSWKNGMVRETARIIPPGAPSSAETTVHDWAADSLGLSKSQAVKLFSMENTVQDLKEIVDALCAGTI